MFWTGPHLIVKLVVVQLLLADLSSTVPLDLLHVVARHAVGEGLMPGPGLNRRGVRGGLRILDVVRRADSSCQNKYLHLDGHTPLVGRAILWCW